LEPNETVDLAHWLLSWKKYLAVEWIALRESSYFTRAELVRAYRDEPVEINGGEASRITRQLIGLGLLGRHDSKDPKSKWEFERLASPWWGVIAQAAAARRQPASNDAGQPRLEVHE
jgi:hypothetical protein